MSGFHFFVILMALLGFVPNLAANGEFRGFENRIVTLFEENRSALMRVKAIYPP